MYILIYLSFHILSDSHNFCSGFKYTQGNSVLTDAQREFYDKNGYILIRNLVDHKVIDECRWAPGKKLALVIVLPVSFT